ncbi:MAG: SDR family NAD(P)-dependent oxidoreductase, partial [Firmicutes bacterium]|nr:SDR family NAD(P)-dependent oxidoreductase [Bacillota bacterium]
LVNNAGYGSHGAVEDVPMAEARRQFEVNVFGLARMTQLVLPAMRAAGHGRIINISSMAGRIWTPFAAWYHAGKFAVEGLSASMRAELKPFHIDVVLIEPGGIQTPWGAIAARHLREASKNGAYQAAAMRAAQTLEQRYQGGGLLTKPEVIANCIVRAATVRRPRTRYLLGFGAKPMVYIQKIFGDRVYDALVRRVM